MTPADFDPTIIHDLIIGLHGYGSDRWQFAKDGRDECRAFRDFATQRNMIAVSPDYRAKTSWMGPAAEADLVQIIRGLRAQYRIGKVILTGGSMGGTGALTFAALHPDLIDGVVAMNPLADFFGYAHFLNSIENSFGGTKQEIPEEFKKRSAAYWPEKLTMPVAFTAGLRDTVVPAASAHHLYQVLKTLGRDVLWIGQEKGGHETNYNDAMEALIFVEEKL